MPPTAATATAESHTNGELIIAGVVVLAIAWYVFVCWFWPFHACPWCSGSGRWNQPFQPKKRKRKLYRACWMCKGTGKRLRLGRRAFNLTQRVTRRQDAKKG